jgi:hypothetical protein
MNSSGEDPLPALLHHSTDGGKVSCVKDLSRFYEDCADGGLADENGIVM